MIRVVSLIVFFTGLCNERLKPSKFTKTVYECFDAEIVLHSTVFYLLTLRMNSCHLIRHFTPPYSTLSESPTGSLKVDHSKAEDLQ